MNYLLSQLVDWVRRAAGDQVTVENETQTSTGSRRITLQNDGYIAVTEVDIDGVALDPSEFSNIGQLLTLVDIPLDGSEIDIIYNNATFSDSDILSSIVDGARIVRSDVKATWLVDLVNSMITDDLTQKFFDPTSQIPDPSLEKLIVYRAALSAYEQKATKAADDAIMIKDGDTTINTALTAKSSASQMLVISNRYDEALKRYRTEGFIGSALTDDYGPYRVFPVKDINGVPIYGETPPRQV